jgi:hypothetical protein
MLDSYAQTFLAINQVRSDIQKEQFKIAGVSLPNNKFNITVQNTGPIPINITRLWVQNTTTTNWVAKYQLSTTITPGGTISNIGQSIPGSISATKAYYVKLVTSRGNTQAFTVNSVSTSPLNIQLFAFPSTVANGFTTELVMIVTNNGTSVLANLVPQISEQPGFTATCNLGTASPASYGTLSPGNTAMFKWDLVVSGKGGQSCTWIGQLQNGYPGNTAQVSVTTNAVTVSSSSIISSFSGYSGVLTMNYSSFKWTQGNQWNSGWFIPSYTNTAFSVKITNNNATGDFYISKQSFFWFANTNQGNGHRNMEAYIVNSVGLSPFSINAYTCSGTNDYCIMVPHGGGTVTLYFGAFSPGTNSQIQFVTDNYDAFLLMYGKFANCQTCAGPSYGQNIPFVAILAQ